VLCYVVARRVVVHGNWRTDVRSLALIGLTWVMAVVLGLWLTRSRLWDELRRRRQPTQVVEPRAVAERTEGGAQP